MARYTAKRLIVWAEQLPAAPGGEVAANHVSEWIRIAKWCRGEIVADYIGEGVVLRGENDVKLRANPGDWIFFGGSFFEVKGHNDFKYHYELAEGEVPPQPLNADGEALSADQWTDRT